MTDHHESKPIRRKVSMLDRREMITAMLEAATRLRREWEQWPPAAPDNEFQEHVRSLEASIRRRIVRLLRGVITTEVVRAVEAAVEVLNATDEAHRYRVVGNRLQVTIRRNDTWEDVDIDDDTLP